MGFRWKKRLRGARLSGMANWRRHRRSGGYVAFTNCYDPLEVLTDGWYGFDRGQVSGGNLFPDETSSLQIIYALKFEDVTGEWVMRLGAAGNEQAGDANKGIIDFDISSVDNLLFVWNEGALRYEATDLNTAQHVVAKLGEEVCFRAVIVPFLYVWYSFAALLVSTETAAVSTLDKVRNWLRRF